MFHLSMVWNCYPELCIKALLSNTVRKSCGQNWKIPSQRHRKWMVLGNIPWLPWGFLKIVVYTVIPEADENYFNPSSIFMSSFWCLFSEVVRILSMPTCHLCHQVRREVLAKGLTPSRTELLGRALTRGAKDLSGFRKKALRFCDEVYELVEVDVIVVACKKRERNINFRFMICLNAFGTFFCSCSVIFTWFDVWFVSSII